MTRYECAVETIRDAGQMLREQAGHFPEAILSAHDVKLRQDRASEKLILGAVEKQFPTDGYLSEERGEKESSSGYSWILDPLDGTVNYYHGIPHCCISLACLRGQTPTFGIVYDFFKDEFFSAERGKGATLNGKPIRVSHAAALRNAICGYGLMKGEHEITAGLKYLGLLAPQVKKIRILGAAALDFCYVACGRLDLFVEFNLYEWDMAAGRIIVKEAGGACIEDEWEEMRLIAATNGQLMLSEK